MTLTRSHGQSVQHGTHVGRLWGGFCVRVDTQVLGGRITDEVMLTTNV